jgi:DNA-binding transcriptional ArsR family regulator
MSERPSLEDTLRIVEGYLYPKFKFREDLDDLLQEGSISAWKDYVSGKSVKAICVRAKYRVLGLLNADSPHPETRDEGKRQTWTGNVLSGRDHQDHKAGREAREKISEWVQSYRKLHGHEPMTTEISKALGMHHSTVTNHLERMYLFSGPYLKEVRTLDGHMMTSGEDTDIPVLDRFSAARKHGQFDDLVCEWIDTVTLLRENIPNDQDRTWTYMYIYEGKTQGDIAQEFGVPRHHVQVAIRRTLNTLKDACV